MKPVLIAEIVSALIALVALIMLIVLLVQSKGGASPRSSWLQKHHVQLSLVLVAASLIHGICATVYASGANPAAYGFGWAALVMLVASGACMMKPLRAKLSSPTMAHVVCFGIAVVLFVAHVVTGKL